MFARTEREREGEREMEKIRILSSFHYFLAVTHSSSLQVKRNYFQFSSKHPTKVYTNVAIQQFALCRFPRSEYGRSMWDFGSCTDCNNNRWKTKYINNNGHCAICALSHLISYSQNCAKIPNKIPCNLFVCIYTNYELRSENCCQ